MIDTVREDRTDALDIRLNRSELPLDDSANERVHRSLQEVESFPRLPMQIIERYSQAAARHADTERLEDGGWYAEIPKFVGVWAQGDSEEEATKRLEAVVRDWTLLKIQDRDRDLPVIEEIDLNVL